jgi:hypothetical protein
MFMMLVLYPGSDVMTASVTRQPEITAPSQIRKRAKGEDFNARNFAAHRSWVMKIQVSLAKVDP